MNPDDKKNNPQNENQNHGAHGLKGVIPSSIQTKQTEIETAKTDSNENTPKNQIKIYSPSRRIKRKLFFNKANPAEWILVTISILLTIANIFVIIYAANQASAAIEANKITRDALNFQIQKTISDSIAQYKKDSSTLALMQESNSLTRRGIDITEKNMFLSAEISKTAIQPFVVLDTLTDVLDFEIEKIPRFECRIRNTGKTPAYKINSIASFRVESDFLQEETNAIYCTPDTIGFYLGSDRFLDQTIWYRGKGEYLGKTDYDNFISGRQAIHLMITIIYSDAFGEHHYTQVGLVKGNRTQGMAGLRKYYRTDKDEKRKTNK